MSNQDGLAGVKFIGYIPVEDVDTQEYRDYIRNIELMNRYEFEYELSLGNFPPGLVILPDGMIPGVIMGRGQEQTVQKYVPTQGIRIR